MNLKLKVLHRLLSISLSGKISIDNASMLHPTVEILKQNFLFIFWNKDWDLKLGHRFTINKFQVSLHLPSLGTGSKQFAILKLSSQTTIGHAKPRDLLRLLWQQTQPGLSSHVVMYWAAIIDDLTRATQINENENKTNNQNGRVC